jgi:hypothetical protein
VRTASGPDENVPADVRSTSWKVYGVSMAKPDIFVVVRSSGLGIVPTFEPLRKSERERICADCKLIASHSRTTEVCVALRQRRTGALGEEVPYRERMRSCSAEKDF